MAIGDKLKCGNVDILWNNRNKHLNQRILEKGITSNGGIRIKYIKVIIASKVFVHVTIAKRFCTILSVSVLFTHLYKNFGLLLILDIIYSITAIKTLIAMWQYKFFFFDIERFIKNDEFISSI